MSMFRNNYKKLVQENNDAIAEISGENFVILQKMFEYMAAFDNSLFELETIKKDLIGMAKEADMEGITLKDKIGIPEKEFCDDLIRNGIDNSRMERKILLIRDVTIAVLGYYTFFWLVDGRPGDYGVPVFVVLMGLWDIVGDYILNYGIRGKGAYRLTEEKKRWLSFGSSMAWLAVFFVIALILPDTLFLVRGRGIVIFIVLLGFATTAFFGNNHYWNKRSEKYNWR